MIHLTRLNDEPLILNCKMIEYVEMIPETKVVMINGKFHLVKETVTQVVDKAIEYYAKISATALSNPVVLEDETLALKTNSADSADL